MSVSAKVLIQDERPDIQAFLLKLILSRGYKAGFAKDGTEIIAMLSNDQYDVVLTNGQYKGLNPDQHMQLKLSSVFIIYINNSSNQNQDMDLKADLYLSKYFLTSELWQALENHSSIDCNRVNCGTLQIAPVKGKSGRR